MFAVSAPAVVANAGAIVAGCLAVVMIFVFMLIAAHAWGKHGMFPTKGPTAGLMARIPAVRRRLEKANREFGWGEMGEDEPPPVSKP